jgi:predicted dehydrogenase
MSRAAISKCSHSHPTAQESQLFRHFAEQVKSGTLNLLWPEMALKTQQVMQACRESSLSQGRPVEVDQPIGT